MAAALAASRFPVTGCMVDRLLADFPSKPAAAQDAVAARLVDVPTTAVAADERAALAALAAGARRVRDLVAESGATELAERLDATYRAACAVDGDRPVWVSWTLRDGAPELRSGESIEARKTGAGFGE